MIAYFQGKYAPLAEMGLPWNDACFVFGATLTDYVRTVNHRLFRWDDHLHRFRADCQACGIALTLDDASQTAIAEELIRRHAPAPGHDIALIRFATPGPIGYYLGQPGGAGDGEPTFGMHTLPLSFARYQPWFRNGATLGVAGHAARNPDDLLDGRIKHRSRMIWYLAEQAIRQRSDLPPGSVGLLLDAPDGHVLETAVANVLMVFDGVVTSPPIGDVLDGIGLRLMREVCARAGVKFVERRVKLAECLSDAREVYLTGTAFGLAYVRQLEQRVWDWPGELYQHLQTTLTDHIDFDIAQQILPNR